MYFGMNIFRFGYPFCKSCKERRSGIHFDFIGPHSHLLKQFQIDREGVIFTSTVTRELGSSHVLWTQPEDSPPRSPKLRMRYEMIQAREARDCARYSRKVQEVIDNAVNAGGPDAWLTVRTMADIINVLKPER